MPRILGVFAIVGCHGDDAGCFIFVCCHDDSARCFVLLVIMVKMLDVLNMPSVLPLLS